MKSLLDSSVCGLVKAHCESNAHPLVVLLGPTASGKTGQSIKLALEMGSSEIINADSRQLYRFLDIGTAKIRDEEMEGIPHHLINVLDPKEEATAGWYQLEARKIIDQVLARGNVPILVGGSMLYIASITDELTMAPQHDEALRQVLMEEYEKDQGASLYKRLILQDPDAALRVHQKNKPRLVRAVEMLELRAEPVPRTELRSSESECSYDLFIVGLEVERSTLHARINERVQKMFDAGWIEEVRSLLERGYTEADPGMKSCGYREIAQYLQSGEQDLETLMEDIAAKTRQYAKRQCTWWRGDSRIHWLSV